MIKHPQKNCRQIIDELLSVFGHFVELALKGLSLSLTTDRTKNHLLANWPYQGTKTLKHNQREQMQQYINRLIFLLN